MNWRRQFNILGGLLLILCAIWWGVSFYLDRLLFGPITWVPVWAFIGVDFLHNYHAVGVWIHGGNPYRVDLGNHQGAYAYPPIVLPIFAWCRWMGAWLATRIWIAAVGSILGSTAWIISKRRGFPPAVGAGLVLFSTPAVFAMERGNCDVLVLVLLALAAAAIGRKRAFNDVLAAICLAVAMWIKVYPGLAVLALIPLRRPRIFLFAAGAGLLIGLIPFHATAEFFHDEMYRGKFIFSAADFHADPRRAKEATLYYPPLEAFSHSLPIYWRTFWTGHPILQRVPGVIGSGLLLLPMIGFLSWKIFRLQESSEAAWPFLLWITLAGTFWMPVSYDYNLIYLPILALAVLSPRRLVSLLLFLPVVVYLQPFRLDTPLPLLLLFKLMALLGLMLACGNVRPHRPRQKSAGSSSSGAGGPPEDFPSLPGEHPSASKNVPAEYCAPAGGT